MRQSATTRDARVPVSVYGEEPWSPASFDLSPGASPSSRVERNFNLNAPEALAEIIPELYRIRASATEAHFRQALLPLFKKYIQFDAGWMAVSALTPHGPVFKCHHLLGLPEGYTQAWLKIRNEDTITPRVVKTPGRAVIMLRHEACRDSGFERFLAHYNIAQTLCNVYLSLPEQICAHIALYRRHFVPVFSERDKTIIEQASQSLLAGLSTQHAALGVLADKEPMAALACLTPKEREVCRQYAEGLTYKDIARQLGVSPFTVRHHLRSVYSKLNIRNKGEMAWFISRLSARGVTSC